MKGWEKAIIYPDVTIKQALKVIDIAGIQAALIVDKEHARLKGIVTDGDIRRAILNGFDLSSSVDKVMNQNPKVLQQGALKQEAMKLMKKYNCHQMPVVDEQGVVVELFTFDELTGKVEEGNPVVIMAGGLGSRLGELTADTPKPLLKVGGRPILESIIENLMRDGLRNLYIAVNFQAEKIIDYFGDGSQFGVNIKYLRESKKLGTAGSLSLLKQECHVKSPTVVMNGDLLTDVSIKSLINYHIENESSATMAVRSFNFDIPYGVVTIKDDKIDKIKEKPRQGMFVNAGIYCLNPEVLENIPEDEYLDMTTLFQTLLDQGQRCKAFPIREYWLDIGLKDDYRKANDDYSKIFGAN